jgi:uncharacterized SAM-binding protein YcdF (DUF218 family)
MASPHLARGFAYDAIVVLGTTVLVTGAPSAILERRLRVAADLFARGAAPTVVVSGGRRWGRSIEARVMQQRLCELGVDPRAIVAELFSLNTVDNAFFCAQLLRERGLARVLLVTSRWHMARGLRHFRAVGVEALPAVPEREQRVEIKSQSETSLSETWAMRLRELLASSVDWYWASRARSATMGGT